VSWPPELGEPLPRASEPTGIYEKLVAYCLNVNHIVGAAEARGFQHVLEIGPGDADYLAAVLADALPDARISQVRDNEPFGVLCEIRVPIAGLRERRERVATVITSWELRHALDRPRLVTAYIGG
jgi:hypothetical protein